MFRRVLILSGLIYLFTFCERPEHIFKIVALPPEDALITYSSALLKGDLIDVGSSAVEEYGIALSEGSSFANPETKAVESGATKGTFEVQFTDLEKKSEYTYKAYIVVRGEVQFSTVSQHFSTKDSQTATVTAGTATDITINSAKMSGEVTYDGGEAVTIRGFCWNSTGNPSLGSCLDSTINGSGPGPFTGLIHGLDRGTRYYVRAYAVNSRGTSYNSSDISFTTAGVPVVTTGLAVATNSSEATCGGDVTADGGGEVWERGVCWNTTGNPTTTDHKKQEGSGKGQFSAILTGLSDGITYFVRAYAVNAAGTAYGEQHSFISPVTDIENIIYKTVKIGSQVWMAENLKTTRFNNGDLVFTTSPASLDISEQVEPKYQWIYNGDPYNYPVYGRLYSGYVITDVRNICPAGWHVPSDAEVMVMADFLGGDTIAGDKLKEVGNIHWVGSNSKATNESGFTALPGGGRGGDGYFYGLLYDAAWWCSNGSYVDWGWAFGVRDYFGDLVISSNERSGGLSVRCLKDD